MRYSVLLIALVAVLSCTTDSRTYCLIETPYGDMKVMLYDETPIHKENFTKLANEGFYDDLLFHRVINGFMIQGGDPLSKDAAFGQRLGMGGPGYVLQPEIGAPHIRGTLAAARDPSDPLKQSSGSQFYIVHGRPVNDQLLSTFERNKNITYNETQRQLYKEQGGTPQLDMDYTVFGEVVEGEEVIDAIAAVACDANSRPIEDVRMKVTVLK